MWLRKSLFLSFCSIVLIEISLNSRKSPSFPNWLFWGPSSAPNQACTGSDQGESLGSSQPFSNHVSYPGLSKYGFLNSPVYIVTFGCLNFPMTFPQDFALSSLCCMAPVILVPRPGMEPTSPALEARSLNHWTTREVPILRFEITGVCSLRFGLQCFQASSLLSSVRWDRVPPSVNSSGSQPGSKDCKPGLHSHLWTRSAPPSLDLGKWLHTGVMGYPCSKTGAA